MSFELTGWDEVKEGVLLNSFIGDADNAALVRPEDRSYASTNSQTISVASWRVIKPVYNRDLCIDCQNCWIFCPDTSIISRDKKMIGIDYDHCKGCQLCVEVCPTNPKSLLMFREQEDIDTALAGWPEKEKKAKKDS
jgi:pyruvate ferredoxin oxidoreductase delta subunit